MGLGGVGNKCDEVHCMNPQIINKNAMLEKRKGYFITFKLTSFSGP